MNYPIDIPCAVIQWSIRGSGTPFIGSASSILQSFEQSIFEWKNGRYQ